MEIVTEYKKCQNGGYGHNGVHKIKVHLVTFSLVSVSHMLVHSTRSPPPSIISSLWHPHPLQKILDLTLHVGLKYHGCDELKGQGPRTCLVQSQTRGQIRGQSGGRVGVARQFG